MKMFQVPEVELVRFDQKDVIATSSLCPGCDTCTICPEGKNDCRCYDFSGTYNNE